MCFCPGINLGFSGSPCTKKYTCTHTIVYTFAEKTVALLVNNLKVLRAQIKIPLINLLIKYTDWGLICDV